MRARTRAKNEAHGVLARTLCEFGACLKAGDIILTGALGPMVSLTPGDSVKAEVGGLGSASFTYEDDR